VAGGKQTPVRVADLLSQPIQLPRFFSDAADLATGAVVVVLTEWRFFVVWTMAIGVPQAALWLALDAVHPGVLQIDIWWDSARALAIAVPFEALGAVWAIGFLAARARGDRRPSWRPGWRRTPQTMVVLAATYGPALLAALIISPLSRLSGNLMTYAFLGDALLTAVPAVVLEGNSPKDALRASLADARTAHVPTVILALGALAVLARAVEALITTPAILHDHPACEPFVRYYWNVVWARPIWCDSWIRIGYLWLIPIASAPIHVLSFLVWSRRPVTDRDRS